MSTLFGLTKTLVVRPIKEMPQDHLEVLRHLSFGPDDGTMWRWSYHDGSTWVAVLYSGVYSTASSILGWSCLTLQEGPLPVLGVYVAKDYRGHGLAEELLSAVVKMNPYHQLKPGQEVYAVSANYPRYPELLQNWGLKHLEWE